MATVTELLRAGLFDKICRPETHDPKGMTYTGRNLRKIFYPPPKLVITMNDMVLWGSLSIDFPTVYGFRVEHTHPKDFL